jgi:hypothetical protein
MENKKTIIKEIEKSLQDAMELLWDVEKKYDDVHNVMSTLRDSNIIADNMQGALLKLTIDRYFEKHGNETEFNDIKKALNDISDAKLKTITLRESILVEKAKDEAEQEAEMAVLKGKISLLEYTLDELKKSKDVQKNEIETTEKRDVESLKAQENVLTLHPTPVREDLFKPKIKKSLIEKWKSQEDLTIEEWAEIRGKIINKISGTSIREHVADAVKAEMDKGVAHIFNTVIPAYYPDAKRISHGIYTRAYHKHLGKQISVPKEWLEMKPTAQTKRDGTENQKIKKYIKTKRERKLIDKIAKKINKTYAVTLTLDKYKAIVNAVYVEPGCNDKEYAEKLGLPTNPTYAHLRYGVEIGDIRSDKRRYALRANGIKKAEKMFTEVDVATAIQPKEYKEPAVKKKINVAISDIMAKKYGTKITDDIAKAAEKKHSNAVRIPSVNLIIETVQKNQGIKQDELKRMLGFSEPKMKSNMEYALNTGRLVSENRKCYVPEGDHIIWEDETEKAEKPETSQIMKRPKTRLEGTPITDNIALNIHIKYGSPPLIERYEKIKNILGSAIMYNRTMDELVEQTEWSKLSVLVQLMYGCHKKIGVMSSFKGDDNKRHYYLKKNKDKIIKPKETKVKSKSWLKW